MIKKKKKQIWLPLSYIHACMHSFWNNTYIITITIAQVDFHSQNLIKRVSAVAHVLVRKLWKVASLEPWHRPDRRRGQDHTTHPSLTFFLLHLLLLSQTKPKHKPLFFDPFASSKLLCVWSMVTTCYLRLIIFLNDTC